MAMARQDVNNYGMTPLVPFWAIIEWKVLREPTADVSHLTPQRSDPALPTVLTGWKKYTAAKAERFGRIRPN